MDYIAPEWKRRQDLPSCKHWISRGVNTAPEPQEISPKWARTKQDKLKRDGNIWLIKKDGAQWKEVIWLMMF
jgi:hypothetical protein